MKKLTITIALILVVALAMPAFGSSFSDVPASHWSYNAINKLVAAGIVEGYPDGEYKGEQSMTRYEMAVMVSRALDNIVDEMEAMNEGLSTGQAEDVTAIVKSLMEKNTNEELSDAQAEEVADIVDALTFELRSELKVLGAQVDELDQDVEKLAATVEAMKVPEDNIEFSMDVTTKFEVADYDYDNAKELAAAMVLWADGDALDLDLPTVDGDEIDLIDAANDIDNGVAINGTVYNSLEELLVDLDEDTTVDFDWEDGDALPSEKRFWQEYDFNIAGNLGEAEFNLAVDTITNSFTSERSAFGYDEGNSDAFEMDSALLEVQVDPYGFRIGDLDGYHMTKYLTDDEDMEGLEMTTNYWNTDFRTFVLGDDDDTDADYYGVEGTKEMTFGNLTGKLYQVRGHGFDANTSVDSTYLAVELTDFEVTEALTMGGELAFNDWDAQDNIIGTPADGDDTGNDIYAMINGEFVATDALTINGMIETVGAEFYAINDDLAGSDDGDVTYQDGLDMVDYDKYQLGAKYTVNENNAIMGSVAMVNHGDDSYADSDDDATNYDDLDDKLEYSFGWANVYGDYTNTVSVSFTDNDDFIEDYDVRVIELGTEYVWDETLTLGAALVNKHEENDQFAQTNSTKEISYNYLKGTADKTLADNITWNTEFKYLVGDMDYDVIDEIDAESSSLTTSLSVSF